LPSWQTPLKFKKLKIDSLLLQVFCAWFWDLEISHVQKSVILRLAPEYYAQKNKRRVTTLGNPAVLKAVPLSSGALRIKALQQRKATKRRDPWLSSPGVADSGEPAVVTAGSYSDTTLGSRLAGVSRSPGVWLF
jgi:hypothetical protein